MKRLFVTGFLIIVLCSANAFSNPLEIGYFQTDLRYNYRIALLKLALEKTSDEFGPFVLKPDEKEMTQARGLAYLQKRGKKIDVAFLPTSKERENLFLPVRIPMLRGILGYRVSLIRKDSLESFSKIETLDQLRTKFTAGFGTHWGDMKILEHNNLKIDATVRYENLFKKLDKKRFDYFPRGINEAWREIEKFGSKFPNLTVDPYIALYYPYPVYFFVNKANTKLAERIERGLTMALNDGSFKTLFLTHHQNILSRVDFKNRKLFTLENPTLPPDTPVPDTSWWLEK